MQKQEANSLSSLIKAFSEISELESMDGESSDSLLLFFARQQVGSSFCFDDVEDFGIDEDAFGNIVSILQSAGLLGLPQSQVCHKCGKVLPNGIAIEKCPYCGAILAGMPLEYSYRSLLKTREMPSLEELEAADAIYRQQRIVEIINREEGLVWVNFDLMRSADMSGKTTGLDNLAKKFVMQGIVHEESKIHGEYLFGRAVGDCAWYWFEQGESCFSYIDTVLDRFQRERSGFKKFVHDVAKIEVPKEFELLSLRLHVVYVAPRAAAFMDGVPFMEIVANDLNGHGINRVWRIEGGVRYADKNLTSAAGQKLAAMVYVVRGCEKWIPKDWQSAMYADWADFPVGKTGSDEKFSLAARAYAFPSGNYPEPVREVDQ